MSQKNNLPPGVDFALTSGDEPDDIIVYPDPITGVLTVNNNAGTLQGTGENNHPTPITLDEYQRRTHTGKYDPMRPVRSAMRAVQSQQRDISEDYEYSQDYEDFSFSDFAQVEGSQWFQNFDFSDRNSVNHVYSYLSQFAGSDPDAQAIALYIATHGYPMDGNAYLHPTLFMSRFPYINWNQEDALYAIRIANEARKLLERGWAGSSFARTWNFDVAYQASQIQENSQNTSTQSYNTDIAYQIQVPSSLEGFQSSEEWELSWTSRGEGQYATQWNAFIHPASGRVEIVKTDHRNQTISIASGLIGTDGNSPMYMVNLDATALMTESDMTAFAEYLYDKENLGERNILYNLHGVETSNSSAWEAYSGTATVTGNNFIVVGINWNTPNNNVPNLDYNIADRYVSMTANYVSTLFESIETVRNQSDPSAINTGSANHNTYMVAHSMGTKVALEALENSNVYMDGVLLIESAVFTVDVDPNGRYGAIFDTNRVGRAVVTYFPPDQAIYGGSVIYGQDMVGLNGIEYTHMDSFRIYSIDMSLYPHITNFPMYNTEGEPNPHNHFGPNVSEFTAVRDAYNLMMTP